MITKRFLNAALFFAENTECLDTIKLYKLLFLADRDCMQKTGHTITESTYRKIQPWGPVPKEIKELVDGMAAGDKPGSYISDLLKVEKQGKNTHIAFSGGAHADMDYFSKEEVSILEHLAKKYKTKSGKAIAHGAHWMKRINNLEWGKDFSMDIFLHPKELAASQAERVIVDKFRLTLANV